MEYHLSRVFHYLVSLFVVIYQLRFSGDCKFFTFKHLNVTMCIYIYIYINSLWNQGYLTYTGLTSLNLSNVIVNNFCCVVFCLIMNRVTICREICLDMISLDIMTLKNLPTSCFRYKSEKAKQKLRKEQNSRIRK